MWRLLHTPAGDGAGNMALDEALMHYARDTGCWVLRVYSWTKPTLSFGRNQTARNGYDVSLLAERGIDVVRRPTGGRAILHDREVTYSIAAPTQDAGDLRESYRRINRLLLDGLRRLGVAAAAIADDSAKLHKPPEETQPGFVPCFHHASRGEITVAGRKLVGSAQWRCDGALLQHGSILVDDDQMQLSALLIENTLPMPKPATLREELGDVPSDATVAKALFDAVRECEDDTVRELGDEPSILERAKLLRSHYLDECWTWRR